jgi:uncharacterized phiE125 gp8 family phage protein
MNFIGPWSDYWPHGFPGFACNGGQRVSMRKTTTDSGFPIKIEDLLLDLRVDSAEEANTVKRMARGAAAFLEKRTGVSILKGTYEAKFHSWPIGPGQAWEFLRMPLRDVTEISWFDGNTSPPSWLEVALNGFFVDEREKSFVVIPLQGFALPTPWAPMNGVRLIFEAGYLTSEEAAAQSSGDGELGALAIPDDMRTLLTMLTGHFYDNRDLFAADKLAEVEASAGSLLASQRMFW